VNERARVLLFAIPLLVGVPLAVLALAELPAFGESIPAYGERLAAIALPERQVNTLVVAIIFDYRGFDTLGEQFIIFAAVIGVALLFRDVRGYPRSMPLKRTVILARSVAPSEATTLAGRVGLAVILVFGIYMTLHGHLTPGGGFQGGAILASGFLLVFLGENYQLWRRMTPPALLDVVKAISAATYVAVGVLGLLAGGAFLENVLPLGTRGSLASGGTIPLLNAAAGVGVAAGLALLFHEYLAEVEPEEEERAQREGGRPEEGP
jgi:multicomponent Na+:H+ antiporter subunit B